MTLTLYFVLQLLCYGALAILSVFHCRNGDWLKCGAYVVMAGLLCIKASGGQV